MDPARYAPPARAAVDALRERLVRAGGFTVASDGRGGLLASRVRRLPGRGVLRLLIPRVVARARPTAAGLRWRLRPDALAWFMGVIVVGGLIVEVTMDRAKYPRDYPPAFIFALGGSYFGLLVADLIATGRALRRAHADPPA